VVARTREVRDNAQHAPAERVEELVRGADVLEAQEGEAAREVGAGGGGEGCVGIRTIVIEATSSTIG
jgi:hypothetical protein